MHICGTTAMTPRHSPSPRATPRDLRAAIVLVVLLGISTLPVLAVDIPAGVDVPNHVARMGVLSRSDDAPHPFYEVDWALYPNLAMDLIVPVLAQVLPVDTATKVFFVAGQVLVVSGAAIVELAHKGRWQWSGLVALCWLYSVPFAWGFMNFTFGCGLALWALACHLLLSDRRVAIRAAAHFAWVAALFVTHFFALGLFGVTAGLFEVSRVVQLRQTWRQAARHAVWLAAPVLLLLTGLHITGGAVGGAGTTWAFAAKALWLFTALNGYSWELSAGLMVCLSVLLWSATRGGMVRVDCPGRCIGLGLTALFLGMPFKLLDTAFVDVRVIVFTALVVPAFTTLRGTGTRRCRALAFGGGGLFFVNLAVVAGLQLSYDRSYDQLRESLTHIAPRSRVLIGGSGDAGDPPVRLQDYPMYNAPLLAVHYRNAFSPTLFTAAGKQPVKAAAAVRPLDVPYGGPVPLRDLVAVAKGQRPSRPVPRFARNWVEDYDYLYVVGAHVREPQAGPLEVLDVGERFVLYRIKG